jgi:hypothetical protein
VGRCAPRREDPLAEERPEFGADDVDVVGQEFRVVGQDGDARIWDSGLEAAGDRGALGREAYLQAFGERIGRPVSRRRL